MVNEEQVVAEQSTETPAPAPAPEAPAAPAGVVSEEAVAGLFSGAAETAAPAAEPAVHVVRGRVDRFGVAMGTGRRKTSVARVRIKSGTGQVSINGRSLEDFFTTERNREFVEAPLKATNTHGTVDIWVRVVGGGTTGQAGAIMLGVARALQAMNPTLHGTLSDNGYLTRDGRMVERKKYGYKKARKSFQFSKR
jgi:small subunit ribosomal protein S9